MALFQKKVRELLSGLNVWGHRFLKIVIVVDDALQRFREEIKPRESVDLNDFKHRILDESFSEIPTTPKRLSNYRCYLEEEDRVFPEQNLPPAKAIFWIFKKRRKSQLLSTKLSLTTDVLMKG